MEYVFDAWLAIVSLINSSVVLVPNVYLANRLQGDVTSATRDT